MWREKQQEKILEKEKKTCQKNNKKSGNKILGESGRKKKTWKENFGREWKKKKDMRRKFRKIAL